jgi:hypothetical protein
MIPSMTLGGRWRLVVTLATTLVLLAGCPVRDYFVDRGRDAADILTLAGGYGAGGRGRIGPLHAGLVGYAGDAGLYAGDITECSGGPCNHIVGFEAIGWGWEQMYPKSLIAGDRTERLQTKSFLAYTAWWSPFLTTTFMGYDASPRFLHPYWTQCEVQVGLLVSARIGINPGELIDFILGWTTLDCYGDDLAGGRPTPPASAR